MTDGDGRRRVHSGQIVFAQVALLPVLITAAHPGALAAAAMLLAITFIPVRQQWLHQWLAAAVRLTIRRRTAPAGAAPSQVLALARPGTRLIDVTLQTRPAAALADPYGMTALIEVDGAGGSAADLALRCERVPQPAVSVHVAVGARPAAGSGTPADSYLEATGGGTVPASRLLVAVRVTATDQAHAGTENSRDVTLATAVDAMRRHLAPLSTTVLDRAGVEQALAALGCQAPVREQWSAVHAAGQRRTSYRISPAPDLDGVLTTPTDGTTAVLDGRAATVWFAGSGPDAEAALTRAAARPTHPAPRGRTALRRLDGEHLPALANLLPPPALADPAPATIEVRLPPSGLWLGHDRDGRPVLAPLFRARPTRAAVVASIEVAMLLAWRALGAGAEVVVTTAQPRGWQPLVRAAAGHPLQVGPAGNTTAAGGQRPLLLHIVDEGVAAPPPPAPGATPWDRQVASVTRLPQVDGAALDVVAAADLVITEPQDEQSGTLLSAALGLGAAGVALRRTSGDAEPALAVVARGKAHLARVRLTGAEQDLVGRLTIRSSGAGAVVIPRS